MKTSVKNMKGSEQVMKKFLQKKIKQSGEINENFGSKIAVFRTVCKTISRKNKEF